MFSWAYTNPQVQLPEDELPPILTAIYLLLGKSVMKHGIWLCT